MPCKVQAYKSLPSSPPFFGGDATPIEEFARQTGIFLACCPGQEENMDLEVDHL